MPIMSLQWNIVSRICKSTDLVMSTHSLQRSYTQGTKSTFHDAASVIVQPFCSKSAAHHHLAATNQSQMCDLLAQHSLGERLGSHSQLEKQRALTRLIKSLLACQLESQQLEPQHNALCLVYWLARRPLDSAYIPPEVECDVAGQLKINCIHQLFFCLMRHTLIRGSRTCLTHDMFVA